MGDLEISNRTAVIVTIVVVQDYCGYQAWEKMAGNCVFSVKTSLVNFIH